MFYTSLVGVFKTTYNQETYEETKEKITIEKLAVMVQKGFSELTKRFETRMDKSDLRLDRLEEGQSRIEARVSNVEDGQERIMRKLDNAVYYPEMERLKTRVTILEKKVK